MLRRIRAVIASALVFAPAALLVLTLTSARGGSESFDPWSPNRKFCGRILVVIVSAGESGQFRDAIPGVDDDLTDPVSGYAYSSFQLLRRSEGMPTYSFLITSDPKLRRKFESLPHRIKSKAGFLGTTAASKDAFEELLSHDGNLSLLQKAIDNFSNDSGCKALMKTQGLVSVLPLLKTEIIIEGQNSESGFALWLERSDSGTVDHWIAGAGAALDNQLIDRLNEKLGDAAVQIFIESCKGATIGSNFTSISRDKCSCYLSFTDSEILETAGGRRPSAFVAGLPDHGKSLRALRSDSPGFKSISELSVLLLEGTRKYSLGGDDLFGYYSGLASGTDKRNPLDAFAFTSADSHAERILKRFDRQTTNAEEAARYLSAGFVEQLPPQDTPVTSISPNADLERVTRFTTVMRKSYASRSRNVPLPGGTASEYLDAMKKFRACANYKNPISECVPIYDIMNKADKGTAPDGTQTEGDKDFVRSVNKLLKEFDSFDVPELVAKYQAGELSLAEFFQKTNQITKDYGQFQKEISSWANEYYNRDLPEKLRDAFHVMGSSMSHGLAVAQIQFFPLLEREILEVRLRRVEEAAKLLVEHESDFPDGEAKQELRQLANDLACQNLYPVGPAFDKIKNNKLPLLPVLSQTAVSSRN